MAIMFDTSNRRVGSVERTCSIRRTDVMCVKQHLTLETVLEDIGAVSRPRLSWSLEHDLSLEDLA